MTMLTSLMFPTTLMFTSKPSSEQKRVEKLVFLSLGKEQDPADSCVVLLSYLEF